MKPGLLIAASVLIFSAAAFGQSSINKRENSEVIAANHAWVTAFAKCDLKTLERLTASEFISTSPLGITVERAEFLRDVEDYAKDSPDDCRREGFMIDEVKVQRFGSVGIVNSRAAEKVKDKTHHMRVTTVYVKKHGSWQAVASQQAVVATIELKLIVPEPPKPQDK